jgi:hypothetical protein
MQHVGRFTGGRRYHYFLARRLPSVPEGSPDEPVEIAPHV